MLRNNNIIRNLYEKYIKKNIKCDDGYITDFKIIAIGEEIREYYIHSFVLDSQFFEVLIDGQFTKIKQVTMNIDNFQVIDDLFLWLYLGKINFNDRDRISNLLKIANEFMFVELEKLLKMKIYI